MPSGKKKGKLTSGEGFTLGADESLGMSIGALFRGNGNKEEPLALVSEEKIGKVKNIDSEKESESGISRLSRVSLQRQTAGRRGRTVTAGSFDRLENRQRSACDEMRKVLGCGSFVEKGFVFHTGRYMRLERDWL